MTIELHIPSRCKNEILWIANVLFDEFLGIDYSIVETESEFFLLESAGKTLQFPDCFFKQADKAWMQSSSLPKIPLVSWDIDSSGLKVHLMKREVPVLFGKPEIEIYNDRICLGIDILGSAFYMLSRYEETVIADRDKHNRFPARASIAFQAGFLDRPIINEYLEILWECMKHLWPNLQRKKRDFRMLVSCDVDHPYQSGIKNPLLQLRHIAGDLVRRKSARLAVKSTVNFFASKFDDYSHDDYYSRFDWMMDVNEAAGNKVAFYFIAGHSDNLRDGCYSLDEPIIRNLIRRVHVRGHEIGLHGSYNSYKDKEQFLQEARNLKRVMAEESIHQDYFGGRQHYLRWETPTTAKVAEFAGMDYDSTLTFADAEGFRCGICYEFPMYDIEERLPMSIRARPLIVMEATLLSREYRAVNSWEELSDSINKLAAAVHLFRGDMTLLWHNTGFDKPWYEVCYKELVSGVNRQLPLIK